MHVLMEGEVNLYPFFFFFFFFSCHLFILASSHPTPASIRSFSPSLPPYLSPLFLSSISFNWTCNAAASLYHGTPKDKNEEEETEEVDEEDKDDRRWLPPSLPAPPPPPSMKEEEEEEEEVSSAQSLAQATSLKLNCFKAHASSSSFSTSVNAIADIIPPPIFNPPPPPPPSPPPSLPPSPQLDEASR